MRGVWHVCIVVAVLLAVPIDSAWAECAWVLWKSSATPDNIREAKWTIVEAHEAREECKTALSRNGTVIPTLSTRVGRRRAGGELSSGPESMAGPPRLAPGGTPRCWASVRCADRPGPIWAVTNR